MELNTNQNKSIAHAVWMLAAAIQKLNCIDGSTNAEQWLEAAKQNIATAAERILTIEL